MALPLIGLAAKSGVGLVKGAATKRGMATMGMMAVGGAAGAAANKKTPIYTEGTVRPLAKTIWG